MKEGKHFPSAEEILEKAFQETQSERETVCADCVSYLHHMCATSIRLFRTFVLVQESKKLSIEKKQEYMALLMSLAKTIEDEIHRIGNSVGIYITTESEKANEE